MGRRHSHGHRCGRTGEGTLVDAHKEQNNCKGDGDICNNLCSASQIPPVSHSRATTIYGVGTTPLRLCPGSMAPQPRRPRSQNPSPPRLISLKLFIGLCTTGPGRQRTSYLTQQRQHAHSGGHPGNGSLHNAGAVQDGRPSCGRHTVPRMCAVRFIDALPHYLPSHCLPIRIPQHSSGSAPHRQNVRATARQRMTAWRLQQRITGRKGQKNQGQESGIKEKLHNARLSAAAWQQRRRLAKLMLQCPGSVAAAVQVRLKGGNQVIKLRGARQVCIAW